ncbi:hypothetical protein [Neptunomonas japonica]|uniref:hypothetical protein n=1 Tax=Neptunomonas japonica TaxID=417574 RepID=UPI001915064A|nr:hypothetical protein [Neptunomonas japonica]
MSSFHANLESESTLFLVQVMFDSILTVDDIESPRGGRIKVMLQEARSKLGVIALAVGADLSPQV